MFDIILRNGVVVDGSGNPWFKADIGIKGDRITKVGNLGSAEAEKCLDIAGLVTSPGFIDIHTHSDFILPAYPRAESKVSQGVTTDVIGNCGMSAAPLNVCESIRELICPHEIPGLKLDWNHIGEYLDWLDSHGIAINVAALVGHNTIRTCVMGYENRSPTENELEEMKKLVAQAMEDGAFGMSTGLKYTPGFYAKTSEIIELCKVVGKYGGIYVTHIRDAGEGLCGGGSADLILSVREAIEIGEKAGVPVHISHHECLGKLAWGLADTTLRMIDEARERGVDVTFDHLSYEESPTDLFAWLPGWAREGGNKRLMERLKDPQARKKIKEELRKIIDIRGGPETHMIQQFKDRALLGKTLAEVAELRGKDPYDNAVDLLEEGEGSIPILMLHYLDHDDVLKITRHPLGMFSSDGMPLSTKGVLRVGMGPYNFGTFPRVLEKYVREDKLLRLEEAIRKMTTAPAQRLGLMDRGLIRSGMYADITVFDPQKVVAKATPIEPYQYPEGIEYVFVNGRMVIEKGEHTGALPGKSLRGPGWKANVN